MSDAWIIPGTFGGITLLGVTLLGFGIFFLKEARLSQDWPSVQGKVNSIQVVGRLSGQGATARKQYHYTIRYTYHVEGQDYTSDRYSLGTGVNASSRYYSQREEARSAARQIYKLGQSIHVYYHPHHPERALLQPGVNRATYVPLVLGLVFTASGLAFLIPWWLGMVSNPSPDLGLPD